MLQKSVFRMANLESIGETYTRYEDYECFWKNARFVNVLLTLTGQSSVPGSRVILPETICL